MSGTPITWTNGTIYYYTDQGDLSPVLQGPEADAFVASAFTQWTAIPTAAVAAIRAGQLTENVSGANFFLNSDKSLHIPEDILPSALSRPVAIVYDSDGRVSNAILGKGASNCFANAAFGGVDNFAANATFSHALIVLNGRCAQTASQLPDMQYRLVRLIGKIFGLDWSQVNVNVLTRIPPPTLENFDGFSVMHVADIPSCSPISSCLPNAIQPTGRSDGAVAFVSRNHSESNKISRKETLLRKYDSDPRLGVLRRCEWPRRTTSPGN
jgi:hypothetical protein